MKLRKKLAAVMAAAIIATSMPTFAASVNGVSKVVTVAKDVTFGDVATAPALKIDLKDALANGQTFYLNLTGAEWPENITDTLTHANFTFTRESKTQLGVKANGAVAAGEYKIPMLAKVTGTEAAVEIDSNDTVVTAGKYVFAVSNDATGKVTVADAKSIASVGTMADITIEEPYIGAFQADTDKQIRVELEGTGFKFNYNKGAELANKLEGKKAYSGQNFNVKVVDETTLEVTIPAGGLTGSQRGALTLTGIQVKADKNASYGDVKATVSGDLSETTEVVVAKYGDYGTELKAAKEYKATAGQQLKDVEFTLSETIADSLNGNRETTFTFPEDITIANVTVVKSSGVDSVSAPSVTQEDSKNTNEFTVASIKAKNNEKASVTFKATLNVPASYTGDINLIAEGRSLEEAKETLLATVEAPVAVEVTPVTVKVGLSKQEGGKIVIKETEKGKLSAGTIFLAIDDSDIKYTKAPTVKVTEGNVKVDAEAKVKAGGIEITVKGKSTKVSTIEISGGELKVDRTVPEGTYAVEVGGSAISALTTADDIDAIKKADFIIVGTPNTEDLENGVKNKVAFVIGQAKYLVNGQEKAMDTAAYLAKEGRTMLPVRYVADALGVKADQILWDQASQTVTILADRVIQVKLGSKEMVINGAKVPMTAAAEIKNSRVFVPVAEIARALGADVAWDATTQTATFN